MRIERVIVESDCVDFPVAGRLREMAERNREAVYLEVAAGSEELCALTRSNRMIGEMKSTVVVSRREGFYIDQAGAGTGNPACDYDIEFVWGCLHRCAFCQQMYFLPRRPYIEICPDVPGILREVKHIVQNSERRLLVFEAGGMTDLLALEPAAGSLREMIPAWAKEVGRRAHLQFLTRSANVGEILGLDHRGTVRVGFSVNLPEFTRRYEMGSATFEQRLDAIRSVLADGYRLHLSFSPILYREGVLPRYEGFLREMKTFLAGCDGFEESALTVETLVFHQKPGGDEQMRRHYPALADELLAYCECRGADPERHCCYPERIYEELLPFLRDCIETHFPAARVSFIA